MFLQLSLIFKVVTGIATSSLLLLHDRLYHVELSSFRGRRRRWRKKRNRTWDERWEVKILDVVVDCHWTWTNKLREKWLHRSMSSFSGERERETGPETEFGTWCCCCSCCCCWITRDSRMNLSEYSEISSFVVNDENDQRHHLESINRKILSSILKACNMSRFNAEILRYLLLLNLRHLYTRCIIQHE